MKDQYTNITAKATEMVEKHSYSAILLALLCLAFAVNFYFVGPGSDGGSGLGGTGKFGGESGLGGTGKGPDFDAGLKLGAMDRDRSDEDVYVNEKSGVNRAEQQILASTLPQLVAETTNSNTTVNTANTSADTLLLSTAEFDVSALRLSLEPSLTPSQRLSVVNDSTADIDISALVRNVSLDTPASIDQYLLTEINNVAKNTLVSSVDILNSLMVAEARIEIEAHAVASFDTENTAGMVVASDTVTRQRIAVPSRPERPDRFNVPSRIVPIQRVDIPTAPPVRPMRTLSTLLNR